jgi:lipopolysaccharide/colanic/teichoic acid biosynthesis glycosyltransferase
MNEPSFRERDVAHAMTAGRASTVAPASPSLPSSRVDAVRHVPLGGTLKRGVDLVVSSIGLIVAGPVILVLALVIRLQDGGPVFYGHTRVGFRHRPFHCLKLRTMVVDGDAMLRRHFEHLPSARLEWEATRKLKDDPRITPLGRFLRKTSLDELPQLVNVLLGQMTLVGPRPHALAHDAHFRRHVPGYMRRYDVQPGLTGLAQISGARGECETLDMMRRRVELDLQYAAERTFVGDIKILVQTPLRLFTCTRAY